MNQTSLELSNNFSKLFLSCVDFVVDQNGSIWAKISIFHQCPPPCLSHNAQINPTQPAITCLKLTKETLEQGVKYVQS